MMEIELNLKHHCIETAINRLHNLLLTEYFKSRGSDSEAEAKLPLVKEAQKRFDFSFLRANYKELAGNSDARIVLTDNGKGMPGIAINDCHVDPYGKKPQNSH